VLDFADLAGGFEFGGERIPLINPQRGIFQAAADGTPVEHQDGVPEKGVGSGMTISARLIVRSTRATNVVDYAFMGTDPNSPDNRWLLDAMQRPNPGHLFPRDFARSVSASTGDPRALTPWR
jgi:putative restriction endonuclease